METLKVDLTEMKGEHQKALVHRKQALNDLHNANREILNPLILEKKGC